MINLLPPEEKERLLLEKKKTILTILWVCFLFFLFCLILSLSLIKVYLQIQIVSQKSILQEIEKESKKTEIQELLEKVNLANKNLAKLEKFYQQKIYFIEILEKISKTLPSGINLTSIFVNLPKISLSGFALDRENLFEFKKNLEKANVSFPPGNPPANWWVKSSNIDFTVTFEIPL